MHRLHKIQVWWQQWILPAYQHLNSYFLVPEVLESDLYFIVSGKYAGP